MAADPFSVRPARRDEDVVVGELLTDAARWTIERGLPNAWPVPFPLDSVRSQIELGEVYLALGPGDVPLATVTLQWSDPRFWGERPPDAGYVHRLATRRTRGHEGWGARLLDWAEDRVAERGRGYVRLDCLAANAGLRRYYTGLGFRTAGTLTIRELDYALLERAVRPFGGGASSPSGVRRP